MLMGLAGLKERIGDPLELPGTLLHSYSMGVAVNE